MILNVGENHLAFLVRNHSCFSYSSGFAEEQRRKGSRTMRATRIGVKTSHHQTTTRNELKKKEDVCMITVDLPSEGLGVLAAQHFYKNDFVCEYIGEHTTLEESCLRLPNLT